MRDGRVSAVVAMQSDVKQEAAKRMAKNFFQGLKDGESPETAMLQSITKGGDLLAFGIPVLYSTLNAPDEFERNRLAAFLLTTGESSFAFLLPQFTLGRSGSAGHDANREGLPGQQSYYRGATFAAAD